jgi:hypothetical protein
LKLIITLIIYCLFTELSMAQVELNELRTNLERVKNDEVYAFDLYNRLKQVKEHSTISTGYYGVIEATLASYTYNPMKKLSYFREGTDRLENAIESDSLNVELRYLRLITQLNAPSLLGYNTKIDIDIKQILKRLKIQKQTLDQAYKRIIRFLLQLENCSESEKKELIALLHD